MKTMVLGQGEVLHVRFFDDDSKEWLAIWERKRVKKYSCEDKRRMITAGFKKLDESKRSSGLGGVNLRLAQFYKGRAGPLIGRDPSKLCSDWLDLDVIKTQLAFGSVIVA